MERNDSSLALVLLLLLRLPLPLPPPLRWREIYLRLISFRLLWYCCCCCLVVGDYVFAAWFYSSLRLVARVMQKQTTTTKNWIRAKIAYAKRNSAKLYYWNKCPTRSMHRETKQHVLLFSFHCCYLKIPLYLLVWVLVLLLLLLFILS